MIIKRTIPYAILTTALVIIVAGSIAIPGAKNTHAAPPAQDGAQRSITVSGFGLAAGSPDIAYMNIGVETYGPDVGAALEENNTRMQAVIDALSTNGVAAEDIRTDHFNIYQERNGGAPLESQPAGEPANQYRVTNIVRVMVRDVDQIPTLLSAAIDAGANQIHGVNFALASPGALEAEARTMALEDARARAQQLADELGVSLGAVLQITEGSGAGMPFAADSVGGRGGGGPPISMGSLDVSVTLQVTFAIE
ncbi:MAG: SIMPL domain-containing protein [Chloroflexi bacterium]|nr:SIMPL domain-containing protein [Chloroflexota bacterium]